MDQKVILLVEDDTTISDSLAYTLRKAGYIVESTVSGKLGVQTALKMRPNLIIADIILPDMNGAEMIRQIRNDAWGKNAKIIVLTNMDESQTKTGLASLNILDYLLKVNSSMRRISEVVDKILK